MSDRRGGHRIQRATGLAKCQYCRDKIEKGDWEVVAPVGSQYDRHFHLLYLPDNDCDGWIYHEWEFIKNLLWKVVGIGGGDYDEFVMCLIELWEEGPV